MLGVLWLIFKIILIIICIGLGIAFAVLLVLLFAPFKYNAFARKKDNIDIKGNISWIFGLIKAEYINNGEDSDFVLKYPFSSMRNRKKDKEQAVFISQLEDVKEEKARNESDSKVEYEDTVPQAPEKKPDVNEQDTEYRHTEKIGFGEKIKARSQKIYNTVKGYAKALNENIHKALALNEKYDGKAVIISTLRLIKKLFKNTGFKVFEINGIIGFEDPSITGKLLGIKAATQDLIPIDMNIDGDFKEKKLEGSTVISGSTNLFRLLFPILIYVLRKPIRPIVTDYMRGEK